MNIMMNNYLEDMIKFVNTERSCDDVKVFNNIIDFIHSTSESDSWYWYPLYSLTGSVPAAAFDLDKLYDDRIDLIENIVVSCGISDAVSFQMQMNEQGLMTVPKNMLTLLYERDENGYNFPWYAETYYFDSSHKWLIYVSHEGTITFAGRDLAETAQKIIPASRRI